jgi:mannose/fructose/N-acetylgalactosamine-specific phosphotransferase system component IID
VTLVVEVEGWVLNLVLVGVGTAVVLAIILFFAKSDARFVNALWKVTTFSVLVTAATLVGLFVIGAAVHYNIVSIPVQYCHYLAKNQYASEWCK